MADDIGALRTSAVGAVQLVATDTTAERIRVLSIREEKEVSSRLFRGPTARAAGVFPEKGSNKNPLSLRGMEKRLPGHTRSFARKSSANVFPVNQKNHAASKFITTATKSSE